MAAYGIPQEQIVTVLRSSKRKDADGIASDVPGAKHITSKTLRKHFRQELDTAAIEANAQIAGSLFQKARGGDTISMIFWLKVRAGWKEPAAEVGGIDGAPIAVEFSWADSPAKADPPAAPE
jgi:hypothetical protein